MKSYSILALMTFLLLGNISLAHAAGACVDLSKAIALANWAVKVNKYSQGDRMCSACASKYPNGMPGAPAGSPTVTGYCCSYDCSSLATWVVRQVPGQTGFPPNNVAPPSTYAIWGPGGPKDGGSPNGWKPCDPSKQPVCAGLGNWGADGSAGPGTISVALCGKHYHANCTGCSPDITDSYRPLSGGTTQGDGSKKIVWVTPPGLEALTTASCSSTCTSTTAAVSPGQGSASPTGTSSAAPVASSSPSNSSSSDTMSQMMPMMMMSMMMQQMMQMMKPPSSGSNSSSGSGNGTGSSSGGSSSGGLGDLLGNLLGKPGSSSGSGSNNSGSGNNGSGSSNDNNSTASSSDILKTLVSTLVTRLKTALTSIFRGLLSSDAQTAAAEPSASPASTTSVLQQQLQQLEDQRAAVKTTSGSAATSSAVVSQPEGSGAAAPANPTQDWHKTDEGFSGDHRLSCAGLGGKNAENCRGRTPSMSP